MLNWISYFYIEENGVMIVMGVVCMYLLGDMLFIGMQWKVVICSFCEYVCYDFWVEWFKIFYCNSFIVDEVFFQIVIMNSDDLGIVMNDDLWMVDWVFDGDIKLCFCNYDERDFDKL